MSAEKKRLRKTTDSLLFGTALTFGFFIIVTLLMSAITVYIAQMKAYKAECIQNIRKIGDYLERQIQNSGQDFIAYQNYYMEHFAEADIPYDFDEYLERMRAQGWEIQQKKNIVAYSRGNVTLSDTRLGNRYARRTLRLLAAAPGI